MKTDLNSLKNELSRLTDLAYLRKEFNRVSDEIRNFDVHEHLSPKAKVRIERLEERFQDALTSLRELQRQVDTNLDRFIGMVRSRTKTARKGRKFSVKMAAKAKNKTARKPVKRAKNKKK